MVRLPMAKRASRAFFLLLLLTAGITACKKSDDTDPQPDDTPSFDAQVNGQSWTETGVSAEIKDGRLLLLAEGSDGSRIGLSAAVSSTGTYTIDKTSEHVLVYDKEVGFPMFLSRYGNAAAGSLKITKFDTQNGLLSGEFSGGAKASLGINETVTFNSVKFENISLDGLAAQSQSMTGTLNGQPYPAFMASAYISPLTGNLELGVFEADMGGALTLALSKTINPGTYSLGPLIGGGVPSAAYVLTTNDLYDAMPGSTLTVTAHDKTNHLIQGTFAFQGTSFVSGGSVSVTNGTFKLKY